MKPGKQSDLWQYMSERGRAVRDRNPWSFDLDPKDVLNASKSVIARFKGRNPKTDKGLAKEIEDAFEAELIALRGKVRE